MQKKTFDINNLCREVFEELEQKAESQHISLHQQTSHPHGLYVYANPNRIKQVLINLVDNAIKYGRPEGNIWVKLQDIKKRVQITVTDDGPGIAAEHQPRIFERFYRIEKSRSRERGGSGLGLAISKHILEAHRASIKLNSVVNKGTTLQFRLSKPKV